MVCREVEYGMERPHTRHPVLAAPGAGAGRLRLVSLRPGRQHQFWVTASTGRGEGRSSQVVSKTTPSGRASPAPQITDIGREIYLARHAALHLSCEHSGAASTLTRWFFQGEEATWVNQAALYGRSQLKIEAVKPEDSGNYTCVIEASEVLDTISYSLHVQGGRSKRLES